MKGPKTYMSSAIFKLNILLRALLCCCLLTIIPANVWAYKAKVIKVADGDTITVQKSNGDLVKVRLYGIDCPESDQAYGNAAARFTNKAVLNQSVDVDVIDTDQYGRAVAIVKYGNTSLNAELARNGYAWYYPQYCKSKNFCQQIERLEQTARSQNTGLWQDANPIAPWSYRKGHEPEENIIQKAERLTNDASKIVKALKGLWREIKDLIKIIINE